MNVAAPSSPDATVVPRARRRPWVVALVIGLVVSGAAWAVLMHREHRGDAADFERAAGTRGRVVADAIELHRALLATVPGLFDASEPPTPESLGSFYARLHDIRPGHVMIGWAPSVAGADLQAHRRRPARRPAVVPGAAVGPDLGVLGGGARGPARPAVGRRAGVARARAARVGPRARPGAARRARRRPGPGESARAGACSRRGHRGRRLMGPAVALVLPVYTRGRALTTAPERRAALRGWAFVVLDPTLVIDHARNTLEPEGLDICLFDVTDPNAAVFLGHTLSRLDDEQGRACPHDRARAVAGAHQSTPVVIGGRRWEVVTQPAPSFVEARRPWQPWAALATGLVLTALLTQTLRASLGREAAVRRAVRDRTAALSIAVDDLRRENTVRRRAEADLAEQTERLRVTLRSIGDAVLTCDADGRVDYMNPAAETLTGWTSVTARDHTLHEVLRFVDEKSRGPRPDIVDEMGTPRRPPRHYPRARGRRREERWSRADRGPVRAPRRGGRCATSPRGAAEQAARARGVFRILSAERSTRSSCALTGPA
jgi:PAS domain S-box-containing protein